MKILTSTVARVLFAIPFLVFGINHFIKADMLAGMVPSFAPGGILWVYLTGIILVLGALTFISGKFANYGGYAIAGFLIITVLTVQIPGLSNPQTAMMAFTGMLKDTGLAGGALLLAGLASTKQQTA
ncbi:MAG: DoxX family protein [Bacteroidetes bacterium]|nr:DoxX family protein [Bacteroidota bacterium]